MVVACWSLTSCSLGPLFPWSLNLDAAEKPRHLFKRPLRSRKPNALQRFSGERLQPFESERQMRTALSRNQRVNLVDDDGFDSAQGLGGLRCQDQIQRLRCGDQNVGRMPRETCPLALRCVAGANADLRL